MAPKILPEGWGNCATEQRAALITRGILSSPTHLLEQVHVHGAHDQHALPPAPARNGPEHGERTAHDGCEKHGLP